MIDFELIAKKTLEDLYEKLDKDNNLDVELTDDGVLMISAPNGEYVLNKHFVTKQIWYSSPVSSLKYFNYIDGKFLERNDQNLTLEQALFDDLTKL